MFDAREAKLLAPGAHLTIDGHPGLRLEASTKGRAWTYRYKSPVDGRMRQMKLGQWPAMSFAAAMGEWEKARQARDAGQDPAQNKRAARAAAADQVKQARTNKVMTLARVCNDYYEKVLKLNRKAKGAAEINRQFQTMLGEDASLAAATYTRAQAYALIERWAHTPVQAGELRRELGAAWDRAIDAGDLPDTTPNWWRLVMRGKLKSKGKKLGGVHQGTAKRVLKDPEVAEVLRWMPNFTRQNEDVLTLYLWTGCRGAELTAMAAEEVTDEPDGLWWTVPKAKTKNAHIEDAGDLRVPLIGRAAVIVRRRKAIYSAGFLFPSRGRCGYVEQKSVSVAVYMHQPYSMTYPEWIRPRLTVTHWTPHDLRRTVRTKLAALGCPDEVAEAVIGHKQEGIKGVYNLHQYDRERRHWLGLVDQHWETLAAA